MNVRQTFAPIFTSLILLTCLVGRSDAQSGNRKVMLPNRQMISVGPISIDQLDLHYEIEASRCAGDTVAGLEAAAVELVGKAIEKVAIKLAYHQEAPMAVLKLQALRMEDFPEDTAFLHCAMAAFGADTTSFYRIVIAPSLIHPRLVQYFAVDSVEQRKAIDTIRLFWKAIEHNPAFLAKVAPDTLRMSKGTQPSAELQRMGAVAETDDPLATQVLSQMREGQLWPKIVEDDDRFRIIQLLYSTNSYYYYRALTVSKQPLVSWLQRFTKQRIPIVFHDEQLLKMVRERFAGVWWLDWARMKD